MRCDSASSFLLWSGENTTGPGSSAEGFEELLDLMGEGAEARGLDGVRTGRVHAEALAGNGVGERYVYTHYKCIPGYIYTSEYIRYMIIYISIVLWASVVHIFTFRSIYDT